MINQQGKDMLNAKIPPIQRIHHKYTFKNEMELVKTSKKKKSGEELKDGRKVAGKQSKKSNSVKMAGQAPQRSH